MSRVTLMELFTTPNTIILLQLSIDCRLEIFSFISFQEVYKSNSQSESISHSCGYFMSIDIMKCFILILLSLSLLVYGNFQLFFSPPIHQKWIK
jgi:hypothetical protein